MPRLVHSQERKVAVLPHLAVLDAARHEGHVAGGGELRFMRVVHGEGDGLAAEPVADVVGVAVDERDAHAVVEDVLEVGDELRVDEVARVGEARVDQTRGRRRVIKVHAEGLLRAGLVEVIDKVSGRGGIFVRMADIVDAATTEGVVGPFDEVPTDVRRGGAGGLAVDGGAVGLGAVGDVVGAAAGDGVGEFHEVVDGVVDGFDAVGVVDGEFGVVGGLDGFVDDAVDDAEAVEGEGGAVRGAVGDGLILVVEVVIENGAIVAAVGFRPEVEDFGVDEPVELREVGEETLQDMPGCDGGELSRVNRVRVD